MSTLKVLRTVRAALAARPDLDLVGVTEQMFLPVPQVGDWTEVIEFFVAPRDGVYDAEVLEDLMMGLVPQLEVHDHISIKHEGGYFRFGRVSYAEYIGTDEVEVRHTIKFDDPDVKHPEGFTNGDQIIEKRNGREGPPSVLKLRRRVMLRWFPGVQFARDALQGKNLVAVGDFVDPTAAIAGVPAEEPVTEVSAAG